jgi:protein-disulfide isomerase
MLRSFALLPILVLIAASISFAQTANEDMKGLENRLSAVEQEQKEIRKELDEIRELLASQHSPAPANVDVSVDRAQFKGEPNARVTLVEFLDFQCPFCKVEFSEMLPKLFTDYIRTGKVKFVIRDFPLEEVHPNALKGAEAARCAGEQGKFWLMHDDLMANSNALDRKNLSLYAQNLGLDVPSFDKCVDTDKYAQQIHQDMADGEKYGVDGTPTFFLGLTDPKSQIVKSAQRLDGMVPYDQLRQDIDALLADKK